MCKTMIEVQNVTKMYKIYDKEKERILEALFPWKKKKYKEFHAVSDMSFNIEKGEIVGIIGRNGSGKSTILKLITGILSPTTGNIQVNGKISALLELGTGFNMEYTGIENIYLSGTLSGISRENMQKKVDEIIKFADIGDFINQPVKNYSSGMFVRLAFAVAISVEPDILIVDEALSVGDAAFQAKCMSKMNRLMNSGTTILFVTHDMSIIKRMCQRCIYLEKGKIIADGKAEELADLYLRKTREEMNEQNHGIINEKRNGESKDAKEKKLKREKEFSQKIDLFREGTGEVRVTDFQLVDRSGKEVIQASFNQEVIVKIWIRFNVDSEAAIGYHIRDSQNTEIMGSGIVLAGYPFLKGRSGDEYLIQFKTKLPLMAGAYNVFLVITRKSDDGASFVFLDMVENATVFEMDERKPLRIWDKVYIPNEVEIIRR